MHFPSWQASALTASACSPITVNGAFTAPACLPFDDGREQRQWWIECDELLRDIERERREDWLGYIEVGGYA